MEKLPLGNSGIQVSCLSMGILQFGTMVDKKTSFELLDAYYEAGGRFIDTANNYSLWHAGGVGTESETILGQWMKERNNRDQLVIATKVGLNREDRGASLSPQTIIEEFEGSLKRLKVDEVDLYYAHADIRDDDLQTTLETFNNLVTTGKVRALGCSNYTAWRVAEARAISVQNGWASYCCIQQRHTYLRPKPGASFAPQLSTTDDLLDYCRTHRDFTLLAHSSLLNGAYSRADREIPAQYRGSDMTPRIAALETIAKQTGATVNQVIYAWMLSGDPVTIPITAPTTHVGVQFFL